VWPRAEVEGKIAAQCCRVRALAGIAGHARGGSPRSFCSFIESAALDKRQTLADAAANDKARTVINPMSQSLP